MSPVSSSQRGSDPVRTNPNGGAIALGHPVGGGPGIAAIFERT